MAKILFDREVVGRMMADGAYSYEMPFREFSRMYIAFKSGNESSFQAEAPPPVPSPTSSSSSSSGGGSMDDFSMGGGGDSSEILDQSEIDALLASMSG